MSTEETAIRALMQQFTTAFNSGDLNAVMQCYLPGEDFVIFDIVPREHYRGADNYRTYFEEMFTHFKGRPAISISELNITAGADVAFSSCFMTVTGTDQKGEAVNRSVRVTDGFKKVDGKWLIAVEHVSVPNVLNGPGEDNTVKRG